LWLAEETGDAACAPEVVGMVGLTVEGPTEGQVRWFLVAPKARGGLGHSLMDTLLDQARAAGLTHLRLWTVDGLEAAARLYTSLGFVRTAEVPGHRFGQDLVEVRYDLDL
jgi:N-acetylglutamate synthase-like GNAT family acetyltransferase